jgi:hypothetical protein
MSPVGPLIGGQIYTHVRNGWTVLMGLIAGLMLFAAFVAAYEPGNNSLWKRFVEYIKSNGSKEEPTTACNNGKGSQ